MPPPMPAPFPRASLQGLTIVWHGRARGHRLCPAHTSSCRTNRLPRACYSASVFIERIRSLSFSRRMQKGSLDTGQDHKRNRRFGRPLGNEGHLRGRRKMVPRFKGLCWHGELPITHVALVLSGKLRVVMDDGSAEDFSKNNVMLLPPGHDAWTVGDEPCAFVEFSRGGDYFAHVA